MAPTADEKVANGVSDRTSEAPKEFEDLIEQLGSFGHWQRVIFVLICLADIWGAMAMVLPVIIGATPDFRCAENDTHGNTSTLSKCPEKDDPKCNRFVFDGDFTSIVSRWSLVCDRDYVSDLVTSVQMAGLLIGALVCSNFSDTVGRKKAYLAAFLFLIVPGFVSAFVPMWEIYAVARFFVGFGFGSIMVVNCVYPLEFVGSRWRTLCGTIGFWAIGSMLVALLGYFIRDWTHLLMISSGSGLIYLLCFPFIPESPRWLIQRRRFQEAHDIVRKIAEKNHKPVPDISVLETFAERSEKEESVLKRYTYLDLLRNWRYCKLALVMAVQWFSTFIIYYEIAFNLRNFSGNRYFNLFLSGFVDLAAMLSVIFINNWLGRKKTLVLYVVIGLASNLVIIFTHVAGKQDDLADVILAFALLGKASVLAGTYVCQIFSAELFPTVIRNQGLGTGAMAGRLGGILSPQIVYLSTYYVLAPHILASVLCCVCLPLIVLLPETNGQPLEDSFEPVAKDKRSSSQVTFVTRL